MILRVRVQETTERDRLRFAFNGKELPQSLLRKINQMYVMGGGRAIGFLAIGMSFVLPGKILGRCRGGNVLEVELLKTGRGRRYRLSYCAM